MRPFLVKQVNPELIGYLDVAFDTQYIVNGDSETRFFPPGTPASDQIANNYVRNPFPGKDAYHILGMGFFSTMPCIKMDAAQSIEPSDILGYLARSTVKLTLESRQRKFLMPLSHFFNIGGRFDADISPGSILRQVRIAGGTAGNHTVTGIATTDTLVMVLHHTPGATVMADLTSEFTISAANTINNTSGTDTSSDDLVVQYWDNPTVGEIATLVFGSKGVINLMDPFPLETDIPFELDVLHADTTWPTAAQWVTSDQGGLGFGLKCVLQYGIITP